jgi:hypothetical protein
MRRNQGFYVTLKVTGERFFIERQWKFDRWYYSADGWDTQATGKLAALRAAGKVA